MRRTAHRRRFHRDRIVRKRQKLYAHYRRNNPTWWSRKLPDGRLENDQAYLGCGRPRCGICHPEKRWFRTAQRMRERHEWERLEVEGWGGFAEQPDW